MRALLPFRSRRHRARRGAAAAEFALTAPILVLLLLGTIEYGNYFSQLSMMNGIVRDACRFGSNQSLEEDAEDAAEAAAITMLNDVGMDCGVLSCTITATIIDTTEPPTLELVVDLPYTQITGVLPETGPVSFLGPGQLRMRAAYPHVGP
ncbi:MAG: pilus assembly protein [Alphaproteobacteria bacterium]|nr:pilus assembly protein [Alphaproteobacteria bacterium]